MSAVRIPPLPEGFRFVTRVKYDKVVIELIDHRDFSLDAFRRRESIKPDDRREEQLSRYGVHVAEAQASTPRKLNRHAKRLANLAWMAVVADEHAAREPAS